MQADGITRATGPASSPSPESKSTYFGKNTMRVEEFDILKTIATVAMVFVHVLEIPNVLDTSGPLSLGMANVIEFFGCVPSAGVFMFAMGFGAACSARSTAKTYVDRLAQLAFLGFIVNFFQQLVPMLLDPADFGVAADHLYTLAAVDIYQFAALAMMYFAAMQVLGRSTRAAKALSVVLVCGCMLVNALVGPQTLTTGNDWLDTFVGLIIRENEYSYFPFVSWIVFPVAGYASAFLYRRFADRTNLPLAALVVGLVAIAASEALMGVLGIRDVIIAHVYPSEEGYYAMHPVCALGALGIICVEFALASWFLRSRAYVLPAFAGFVGRNVLHIYVAQWILIGLLSPVLFGVTSVWLDMLISAVVLALSCLGAWLRNDFVERSGEEAQMAYSHVLK